MSTNFDEIRRKLSQPKQTRIVSPDEAAGTPKQRARELMPEQMPPCPGNPGAPCAHPITHVVIAGFDGLHRCVDCHAVHTELIYREAGETPPATPPQFIDAHDDPEDKERRRRILAKYRRPA